MRWSRFDSGTCHEKQKRTKEVNMSGHPVNVNDTGYTVYNHYESGRVIGGYVRCEDCKAARDFVGVVSMGAWMSLHARFGHMFSCRTLNDRK